jgi:hypothetical protein
MQARGLTLFLATPQIQLPLLVVGLEPQDFLEVRRLMEVVEDRVVVVTPLAGLEGQEIPRQYLLHRAILVEMVRPM